MNRRLILFLASLLVLAIAAAAQNPPAQSAPLAQTAPPAPVVIGPAKIAFVNIQQAVATCDEGKREFAVLQQYIDKKSAELQVMQKEIDTLKNTLDIQGSKLTDEARADMADQIEVKDTMLQRFQQDTQKDIDKRRTNIQNAIARKTLSIIEKVAKEKGLSLVQFIDPNRDGFIDPILVITEDVIKAYNAAYPTAAAPAAKK
jgi:outer membrane protein